MSYEIHLINYRSQRATRSYQADLLILVHISQHSRSILPHLLKTNDEVDHLKVILKMNLV